MRERDEMPLAVLALGALALTTPPNPLHTSSLAGNVNFDPLGLARVYPWSRGEAADAADGVDALYAYREAELKHARLAMLAAIAYPAQEALNPYLAAQVSLPNRLAQGTLSPSLVNGDLSIEALLLLLGFGAGLELDQLRRPKKRPDLPGDYGLRVGATGPSDLADLSEAEIWNGRLAMIAVVGYTLQELVTKKPVLFFLS